MCSFYVVTLVSYTRWPESCVCCVVYHSWWHLTLVASQHPARHKKFLALFLGINRAQRFVPWTKRIDIVSAASWNSFFQIIVYNLVPRSWSVCLSLSSLLQALCFTSAHFSPPPGLTLSVSAVAAVSDDISISVNWLLDLQRGDLNCKLTTGDGHIIYLHSPEGWVASCADRLTVSD